MLEKDSTNPALRLAIRAALTGGSLVASFGVANAQQVAANTATPAADASLEEVVVTGSRIAVPNQTSIAPITFVSAVDIQRTGVTRVEDMLNQLPQIFADQTAGASNGSDGTADINLRGLGAKRTLVLVNGQRLGPGDPLSGGQADINMIPVEMIDSIEVLTGGASSVYGADAAAGVVNFKLNDHFEGVKVVADAGIYQNTNTNVEGVENAIAAAGDAQAPSNTWAGAQKSLAVIAGLNSPDGNGNATFYATYRNVLPALGSQYSYSACSLGSGYLGTKGGPNGSGGHNGAFDCLGSATAFPLNILNGTTGQIGSIPAGTFGTLAPNSSTVVPGPSTYNFGALNYFQRPDQRYTAGAFMHYEFNEHATVYMNSMFMDDQTLAQVAGSGDFGQSGPFNCSNPFLSPSENLAVGCNGGTTGMTNPGVLLLRRDVEGLPRVSDIEHMDFHEVIGIKGKINDAWNYDATYNYSLVNLNSDLDGYFSNNKLTNALNVTGTAANAACVSGPPCVPYNPFQPGGVTAAALNYLDTPGIEVGRIAQTDVMVNLTGDMGKYGVKLPTADSGLQLNLGVEYRDTTDSVLPDSESQLGDLSGTGGPTPPISGGVISREAFAEARMPLMDDQPFAKSMNLDTAYRYSDYNLGFKTNTYNIGLDWQPVQDIRIRGSFSRAVRAPNVVELFSPASVGLDGSYTADPCAGPTPVYSAAQCAKTGVTAAEYGKIAANPAGQYYGLLGGNPDLKPETAITKSVGLGFTPSFLPNFRAQIDWYNINIQNTIQSIGGSVILSQCATQGLLCNDITRGPGGSLWTSTSGFVTDTLLNVGDLEEDGVDLDMSYSYDMGAGGKLVSNIVGTYIDKYEIEPVALSPATAFNCAGLMGPTCSSPTNGAGTPVFRWRHRFSTTWETPWSGLDVTLAWRYYSAVTLESLNGNPNLAAGGGATIANGGISTTDSRFPTYSYFDLTAAVKLSEKVGLRLGVNNLLDKAPPLVGSTNIASPPTGNNNTYPGTYDSLGRFIFAEVTATF
jgi:outer membrane receptor protein involved in Fe transport